MAERGTYRNETNGRQLLRFDGMRWGKITPTDIDGFIDFGDRLFVFIEAKHGDAPLPIGQQLAFERLCDACHNPPRRWAIGYVVEHRTSGDILLQTTAVREVRWKGEWKPAPDGRTLVESIERMRRMAFPNNEHADWISEYERTEDRASVEVA